MGNESTHLPPERVEKRRDISAESRYLRLAEGLAVLLRSSLESSNPDGDETRLDISDGQLSAVLGSADRDKQIEVLQEIEVVAARKAAHVELMFGRVTTHADLRYDTAAQTPAA